MFRRNAVCQSIFLLFALVLMMGNGVSAEPTETPDTFAQNVSGFTTYNNVVYWFTNAYCPPVGPNSTRAAGDPVMIQRSRTSGWETRTLFYRNDSRPVGECNPYSINVNDGLVVDGEYIYWRDAQGVQRLPLTANTATIPELVAAFPTVPTKSHDFCGDGALQWSVSDSGSGSYRYLSYAFNSLESLQFGDFNGDGQDDVFSTLPRPDGFLQWVYSPSGTGGFVNIAYDGTPEADLRLGDFNGDGRTDVFALSDNGDGSYNWYYSSAGNANYALLNTQSIPLSELRFGDFNGNGTTDVFTMLPRQDGLLQWAYSEGGTTAFINLGYASTPLSDLRFGDFDGDGATDIFTATDNGDGSYSWLYSSAGLSNYIALNQSTIPLADLRFGDFDGNGRTDVFATQLRPDGFLQWQYSADGTGAFQNLAYAGQTLDELRFADFNGDGRTDVFATLPRTGCKTVTPTFYGEPTDTTFAIALGIGGYVRWSDAVSGQNSRLYSSPRFSTPIGADESKFVNYDSVTATDTHLFFVERYQDVCNISPGCFTTPIKTILKRVPIYYDFYKGYLTNGNPEEIWYGTDPNITPGTNKISVPTDGQFLFWVKDGNLLRLPVNAAALPRINLRVTGMEITQGIQNSTNSVRLIRGKDTHVRLFARSDGASVPDVTARIYVIEDGAEMGPFYPDKSLTLTNNPNRLAADQSFTFHLPLWAVDGNTIQVRAVINPFGYPFEPEGGSADNTQTSNLLTLSPSPELHITFAEFNYTLNGTTWQPQGSAKNASWIMKAYPLGYIWTGEWYDHGLDWDTWQIDDAGLDERVDWSVANCGNQATHVCGAYYTCNMNSITVDNRNLCASDYINGRLNGLRSQRGVGPGRFLYGEIRDTGVANQFPRGQAGTGRTSTGPDGTTWDGFYAGHEVGHTAGLGHPQTSAGQCGLETTAGDTTPSHPNAQIGPNDNSVNGFVYANLTGAWQWNVLPGSQWQDMMGYCRNANWPSQWISDQNYERAYNNLINTARSAEQVTTAQVGDWLAVFGSIAPTKDKAALAVVERWSEVMTLPDIWAGDYGLFQLDANGNELARVDFAPSAESDEGWQPFELVVPFAIGTTRIQIKNLLDDTVIAEKTISATPPSISNLSAQLNGDQIDLTWQANDVDGDSLTFDILYSRDGGATYQPLQLGVTTPNSTIAADRIGGGDIYFQVIANDGVQTSKADSAALTLPYQAPQIRDFSPDCSVAVNYGETINFSADAWDIQDGALSGMALAWYLNGSLYSYGNAFSVQGLDPDLNEIVLIATNSAGLTAEKLCALTITDDLSIAGPIFSVAPQQIEWRVDSSTMGTQSAELTLDNSGGGTLTWEATHSAAWLTLDTTTGGTPATLMLTADPTGMGSGTQNSVTVTLTARDANGNIVETAELPVTLWVDHPGYAPAVKEGTVPTAVILRQLSGVTTIGLGLPLLILLGMGTLYFVRRR